MIACQALAKVVFETSRGLLTVVPGQMFKAANEEQIQPLIDAGRIRIVHQQTKIKPVTGKTLYDYWVDKRGNLRKGILTHDGHTPSTVLYFPETFLELGCLGYLTGRALEDYQRETGR